MLTRRPNIAVSSKPKREPKPDARLPAATTPAKIATRKASTTRKGPTIVAPPAGEEVDH